MGKRSSYLQLSVGFIARTHVRNVGSVIQNRDTTTETSILVASKTITQLESDHPQRRRSRHQCQLWGLGGNAPEWSAALSERQDLCQTAERRNAIFCCGIAQQAVHPDELRRPVIPTTILMLSDCQPAPERQTEH